MLRRKVRDREEAAELLDALDRSGMRRAEFCAFHGIDGRSLHCWELNLGRAAAGQARHPALRLLEVTVVPARTATYRVHVGDRVVEVGDDFDDATLVRLLDVLARC